MPRQITVLTLTRVGSMPRSPGRSSQALLPLSLPALGAQRSEHQCGRDGMRMACGSPGSQLAWSPLTLVHGLQHTL